jgi:hypothetical protein
MHENFKLFITFYLLVIIILQGYSKVTREPTGKRRRAARQSGTLH